MEIKQAVKTCLFEKFAKTHGRATRSEFWWFIVFLVILNFAFSAVIAILYASIMAVSIAIGLPGVGTVLGVIIAFILALGALALLIPTFCVTVRRLHDRDMSGLWVLLILIPSIGSIILLVLCALKGTKGPNRFGIDVLENEYNTYRDFTMDTDYSDADFNDNKDSFNQIDQDKR